MTEKVEIVINEGDRIKAKFDNFVIEADQGLVNKEQNLAPSPMILFITSLGTCTGVVIRSFCEARNIDLKGINLLQYIKRDEKEHITAIEFKLQLPNSFPEKYKKALLRAANSCTVKKHLASPPEINITLN